MSTPLAQIPRADVKQEVASLWQHPFMQNVMPFLTSVVLHVSLIVVAALTFKAITTVARPSTEEQTFVPETDIATGASPDGIRRFGGPGDDPTVRTMQNVYPDVPPDSQGWATRPGALDATDAGGGTGHDEAGAGVIGPGGRGGRGDRGVGGGKGNGIGPGTGGGGPPAPFGPPQVGGGGTIFTPERIARRVCYVCDASGSMNAKFDALRDQIARSVSGLRRTQAFNIVFFRDEKAAALSDRQLQLASGESRDRAAKFLQQVVPIGQTLPIPALELAFRQEPELIYLLTDGEFPSNDEVINWIREHNKAKKIRIHTIAFVNRGDEYEQVLKTIASENGGVFKYVSEEELEK